MNSTQGSVGGGIATDPSPSHKGCGRAAGSRFWKPLFHLVKQGSELTIYLKYGGDVLLANDEVGM